MDEDNRRALLNEVRKSQETCRMLRTAIMVAARHCEFPRWVPFEKENGGIYWEHHRLKLGRSLQTPSKEDLQDGRLFWQRIRAIEAVKSVLEEERQTFADDTCAEILLKASSRLATVLPALRIILFHAQEYGVCWSWLKTAHGPGGTEQLTASELAEALLQPTVGKPTQEQLKRRTQAAEWLKRANITYIGLR